VCPGVRSCAVWLRFSWKRGRKNTASCRCRRIGCYRISSNVELQPLEWYWLSRNTYYVVSLHEDAVIFQIGLFNPARQRMLVLQPRIKAIARLSLLSILLIQSSLYSQPQNVQE